MKKNLLESFVLQLQYNLNFHTHIEGITYKYDRKHNRILVTIEPTNTGAFHHLDLIYSCMPNGLMSFASIENSNLVIQIF